jgi:hypothetical protein
MVAIGSIANGGGGVIAGHVRIYRYDSGTLSWQQYGSDIDGTSSDLLVIL